MKYLCTVIVDNDIAAAVTPEGWAKIGEESQAYDRALMARGVFLAAEALAEQRHEYVGGVVYAMAGGRAAATAAQAFLASGRAADLKLARKMFIKEHGTVFKVLRSMQDAYYRDDTRRERFVSLCHDIDVQRLTFEAYMNKRLVAARPMAHVKIGLKNLAHLMGLVRPEWS